MRRSLSIVSRASVVAGALLLLVGAGGCEAMGQADAADRGAAKDDEQEVPTPVVTTKVGRGEIRARIRATSTIEAERMVTVHAETTGRLTRLSIEEGDDIKSGQLLARIRQDAQRSGLDRANTSVTQAKRDLDTARELFSQGIASKDELNTAERTYEVAKLDVRDRKRDVRNTRVEAPFGGTVTERFVTEGAFVSAGAQLLSIVDFDTLVARVYVPEKELDRLRVGQDAEIVGKAAKGRHGVGQLRRIAPVVDASTGTVKLTIGLPTELVGGDTGFLPGMYAEVTLTTEIRPQAVLLPKQAMVYDEEQPFVFIADGDRVKRVQVTLGLTDRDHAEVIDGVALGDEIVLSGHAGLKDGGLVQRVDPSGAVVDGADAESPDAKSPDDGADEAEVAAAVDPDAAAVPKADGGA